MTIELLTSQPARHASPTVKATALVHLIFERPDLDEAERFLVDFGLAVAARTEETLYLRGTAAAPYCYRVRRARRARFVGFGLRVASRRDLAAKRPQYLKPGDVVEAHIASLDGRIDLARQRNTIVTEE